MNVVLVPFLPKIREQIKLYGSSEIVRIDLDENEFERFYKEAMIPENGVPRIDLEHVKYDMPRKGSYARYLGVTVQCCY